MTCFQIVCAASTVSSGTGAAAGWVAAAGAGLTSIKESELSASLLSFPPAVGGEPIMDPPPVTAGDDGVGAALATTGGFALCFLAFGVGLGLLTRATGSGCVVRTTCRISS